MSKVKQYRKKPVVIDALLLTEDNYEWTLDNFPGDKCFANYIDGKLEGIIIYTLEGDMHADLGDYIIKGVQGEFYPCKPDIFEATYELVKPKTGDN